jgi:glycine/D-amino acid oxidase-like deaminating enzyme
MSCPAHDFSRALLATLSNVVVVQLNVSRLCDDGVVLVGSETLHSSHTVVATNAWINKLLPKLEVVPIRGQLVHARIPRLQLRFGVSIDDSYTYVVPSADGGLVFGGMRQFVRGGDEDTLDDAILNPETSSLLRWGLQRYFRLSEKDYAVTNEWTGIMGFTPDDKPYVGSTTLPNSNRVHHVIAGFNGHGMPQAFLAARSIAQTIVGVEITDPVPREWDVNRVVVPAADWDDEFEAESLE